MWKTIWKVISNMLEWSIIIAATIGVIGMILPRIFQIVPYIVLSSSMEPEISAGSIVYIDKNIKIEDIDETDIIGYHMNNGIRVVHRVIELDREQRVVTTKGDANKVEDLAPVYFEQIEGKSIISIPYLGYGVAWIRSTMGLIVITFLVVLFLAVTLLKRKDHL